MGGWVKRKPRFYLPAVPRRSSWDNLNRDWCGHITGAHIHRNVYRHVAELRTVLEELYALENVHRLRFHWPESKSSSRRGYPRPGGAGEFFFSYQPQKRADGAALRRARPSCLLHCSVPRRARCQSADVNPRMAPGGHPVVTVWSPCGDLP